MKLVREGHLCAYVCAPKVLLLGLWWCGRWWGGPGRAVLCSMQLSLIAMVVADGVAVVLIRALGAVVMLILMCSLVQMLL